MRWFSCDSIHLCTYFDLIAACVSSYTTERFPLDTIFLFKVELQLLVNWQKISNYFDNWFLSENAKNLLYPAS